MSDRVNITQAVLSTNNEENKYGGHVKFTFRNFLTKIRFGFYETIPGYDVQIKDVTYGSVKNGTSDFGVNSGFYAMPDGSTTSTKFIVTYENGDNGTTANKAQIKADDTATKATSMEFGTNLFTANLNLAETSAGPTYSKGGTGSATYTSILPNPDNKTNMTFKISYKLISKDTKEEIEVNNQDVTVPYQYCQWKSNYAYTYIFKISDQSAKLYPITFDACVVQDETGKQETITEVGEPSITTFATTTDANGKKIYRTGADEYKAGDVIYATVLENGGLQTLSTDANSCNVKLYTVETSDATNFPITESSVANAISTTSTGKKKITVTDATGTVTTTVPAEDGSTITLTSGNVLTWTPTAAATYAIQYKGTDNKLYYKIVKVVAQ